MALGAFRFSAVVAALLLVVSDVGGFPFCWGLGFFDGGGVLDLSSLIFCSMVWVLWRVWSQGGYGALPAILLMRRLVADAFVIGFASPSGGCPRFPRILSLFFYFFLEWVFCPPSGEYAVGS